MSRTALVPVAPGILHTSGTPLCKTRIGYLAPDAADALLRLRDVLAPFGAGLRVSDCLRSVAEQAEARRPYDAWLAAGKPNPPGAGQRAHYASLLGRSWHCAGRAIDLDVVALAVFSNVGIVDRWRRIRDVIRACGWRPITPDDPDDGLGPFAIDANRAVRLDARGWPVVYSEAWHYEFRGVWGRLHDGTPPDVGYEGAALGATLDVCSDADRALLDPTGWREVQAQLHRAGYDAGPIDGQPGQRTFGALRAAGGVAPGAIAYLPDYVVPALAWTRALKDAP